MAPDMNSPRLNPAEKETEKGKVGYTIPAERRQFLKIKIELAHASRDSPMLINKICPLLEELGREIMSPDMQAEVFEAAKDLITSWNLILQDGSDERQTLLAVTTLSIYLSMVVAKTKAADKSKTDSLLQKYKDGPREFIQLAASMLYRPLIRILEDGDREAQKRAAWCIHFLSTIAPDGKIRWSKEERAQTASLLIPLLAVRDIEVKIATCHALSMSMQKDLQFRAHLAESGGVPPLLRLLQDPRVLAVTAAAGALHALVNKQKGWAKWMSELGGIPILIHVLERLPPGPAEHRFALLQVLWIFGNMAGLDEEVAEDLINTGLLNALFVILVTNAAPGCKNRDDVVDGAAGSCLEAILLGDVTRMGGVSDDDDVSKARKRFQKKVVVTFGLENISEFRASPLPTLRHIAHVLMPLTKEIMRKEGEKARDKAALEKHMAAQSLDDGENALRRTSNGRTSGAPPTSDRTSNSRSAGERGTPVGDRSSNSKSAAERNSNGGHKVSMRNALVIGVTNYSGLTKVKHASADAAGLASALTKADFQVTSILDPDGIGLRSTIVQFESRAMAGSLALIYFCGHGTRSAVDGHHFLLPSNFEPLPVGHEEKLEGESANLLQNQAGDLDLLLAKLRTKGVRFTIIITDAIHSNQTEAASARAAATGDYPNLSASLNASLPSPRLRRMSEQKDVDGGDSIAPAPPARASASGASPPSRASTSGMSAKSSLTGTLGSTERKSRTSPGGTKTLGPKSRATQTLVWSGAGLAASLVIDSSSTGSESRGPEKGCRHSLFMECILRYSFIKNHIFKKSLNSVISTVRDHSKGAQIPYLNDTAELPSDWRMVEE